MQQCQAAVDQLALFSSNEDADDIATTGQAMKACVHASIYRNVDAHSKSNNKAKHGTCLLVWSTCNVHTESTSFVVVSCRSEIHAYTSNACRYIGPDTRQGSRGAQAHLAVCGEALQQVLIAADPYCHDILGSSTAQIIPH